MRGTHKAFLCFLLPILFLAAGALEPARAQQQEKRIALVVGNGAYAKSPLATTANDAGLIAQTLQAAGFDVVGARDLDGDTLRKSFRDFIQKAQASGPGTVAMVYLAGYGVQLAGENYFIPVDSNITRDTDIPTEALRISDYARQLAAIPLKANIVVLDAARAQPFIEGGQPIASGLALVEPDQNMLIAFNAAPGTVAPEEPGPYGIYAQSLAEMIRTGGLPLPDVFDRVRLRVNEASKGAQVPWNEQKISAPFSFFDRGPDAPPPEASAAQVAAIRNKPIRDLGVQDAYAAALERDTLPAYEEFLAAYPTDPMSKRVMAIVAARREAITWRRTYRTDTPEAYWSYLRRYPRGPHAGDARRRLAILTAPAEPPPSFAMIDYDVPPPPPEEVVYVDRPVLYFSDPDFGFAPPPPPPVYYLPPPPPDFVVLEPPLPVVGLFVLPQPMFVPIPVFVRPPVYVAPPPNNIIFNNIHNTTVINTVINRPPAPPPAGGGGGGTGPGNLTPAIAGRANPVAPMLPQAATQRAALIQQGKAPMPLSATVQPTARPGIPPGTPANVAPNARPSALPGGLPGTAPNVAPQTRLPAANTLPVPGSHGGPPAPPAGAAGTLPGGKPLPSTATAPGTTLPTHPGAPTTAAPGTTPPPHLGAPTAAAPTTGAPTTTNPAVVPGQPPKPPVAQTPPGAGPADRAKSATREPAGPPPAAAGKPVVPPPSAVHEPIRPQAHPPAPPQAAKPAAPPPRPQAVARPTPPPAPRVSAPPPRMAAPPPPRPAPPVAVARPAPPPMARPAPPPPVARPAPPPPPRVAVAPPPRPAAPPPRPAAPPPAAKKCPPNQPKC